MVRNKFGQRAMQKSLMESVVDVKSSPNLRVIVDVGNANYFVNRAIEMLRSQPANITEAITLLTFAKLEMQNGEKSTPEVAAKATNPGPEVVRPD